YLFLLCVSAVRDPRHLLPFPTRRSSDLRPVAGAYEDQPAPGSMSVAIKRLTGVKPDDNLIQIEAWYSYTTHQDRAGVGEDAVRADRKSTRLNSSHVKTSYAVFCLKKKKK